MYKQYYLKIEGVNFNAELCRVAFMHEELIEFYADAQYRHLMYLYHPDQYCDQLVDPRYDAVFLNFIRRNIHLLQQSNADSIRFMVDVFAQENCCFQLLSSEIYLFLGQHNIQVEIAFHLQDK